MKFSIVVPLYNKAESIENTIFSILKQIHTEFELIVIDDGSTDGSLEIVKKIEDHRLMLVKQYNSGVSVARNLGIKLASHSHIVFVDADDTLSPEYLKHMVELIKLYPQAGAFGAKYAYVDKGNSRSAKISGLDNQPLLINDYFKVASKGDLPIIASGVCIPRIVFECVGEFPTDQAQGEDQDLWARIALHFPIAIHPSEDIYYHLDAENRVSVEKIPREELAYSKNLQLLLEQNRIPRNLINSVKKYISGHLMHLVQLNIKAGRLDVAKKLLKDYRTRAQFKRRIKWQIIRLKDVFKQTLFGTENSTKFKMPIKKQCSNNVSQKARVLHLVNDTKMGGITSSIDALGRSKVGGMFDFVVKAVNPKSWFINKYRSEIIIVHYACSWATLIPNLLTRLLNPTAKVILHEHHYTQSFEKTVPSAKRFRLMLRLNYKIFDKIVAVSHGQAKWVDSRGLVNKKYLEAIQQCNDLAKLLKVGRKNVGDEVIIGAFGRLVPVKGFDTLIKAFNKTANNNLKLLIGGSGPEKGTLKRLANDNANIQFTGRVNNVPEFLEQCDVIIIPSTSESFGQVCLEAKAAGKAVIVSNIDGLREQVVTPTDRTVRPVCGDIIRGHSVEAIADILKVLQYMPLKEWGENGREDVRYDWQVYQRNWTKLLNQLSSVAH